MRFMSLVKSKESKLSPPPKSLMEAIDKLVQEAAKEGCVMVQAGGLFPTFAGARVRLDGGKVTVTDGPFTEAKEVVGGFAVFDVPSKAEMIKLTERFMALHKTHMPGWEGECEIRQMAEPGGAEPCVQTQEAPATA
jgi:hypothetical protein